MNILVTCEESQAVTKELRKLGYNAFSCDIESCSGRHKEWNMKCNDCMYHKPLQNCPFTACSFKPYTTYTTNKTMTEEELKDMVDLFYAHGNLHKRTTKR